MSDHRVRHLPSVDSADLAFQERMLGLVSRTFALTIPQLPQPLQCVVANAYLWCRIADTVEDEPALPPEAKARLHESLIKVLQGDAEAALWARRAAGQLTDATVSAERELVASTATIARITQHFNQTQTAAISGCVARMCSGMRRFELAPSARGLETSDDLDCYCYYVAGVVGEMLTSLFCDHSPEIARHESEMAQLATSFGQGLQMTNILKDVWEDRKQGRCWLPRELFSEYGYNLNGLDPIGNRDQFNAAVNHLVAVAHGHLRNALNYTLFIPRGETGIRRFCLWSVGLAVLTLRRIVNTPGFTCAEEVKVSRLAVSATVASTNLLVHHNLPMRLMFELAAHRLPLQPVRIGRPPMLDDAMSLSA